MKWLISSIFILALEASNGLPTQTNEHSIPSGSRDHPSIRTLGHGPDFSKKVLSLTKEVSQQDHTRDFKQEHSGEFLSNQNADSTSSGHTEIDRHRSDEIGRSHSEQNRQTLNFGSHGIHNTQNSHRSGDHKQITTVYQRHTSSHDQSGSGDFVHDGGTVNEEGNRHLRTSSNDDHHASSLEKDDGGLTHRETVYTKNQNSESKEGFSRTHRTVDESHNKGSHIAHRKTISGSTGENEDNEESNQTKGNQGHDNSDVQGTFDSDAIKDAAGQYNIKRIVGAPGSPIVLQRDSPARADVTHITNQDTDTKETNGDLKNYEDTGAIYTKNIATEEDDSNLKGYKTAISKPAHIITVPQHRSYYYGSDTKIPVVNFGDYANRAFGVDTSKYISNNYHGTNQFINGGIHGVGPHFVGVTGSRGVDGKYVNPIHIADDTQLVSVPEYQESDASEYLGGLLNRGPSVSHYTSGISNDDSTKYVNGILVSDTDNIKYVSVDGNQGDDTGKYVAPILVGADTVKYVSGVDYQAETNEYVNGVLNRGLSPQYVNAARIPGIDNGQYINPIIIHDANHGQYAISNGNQATNSKYLSEVLKAHNILKYKTVTDGYRPIHYFHGPDYDAPNTGLRYYDAATGHYMGNPSVVGDDAGDFGGVPRYIIPGSPGSDGYTNEPGYRHGYYRNGGDYDRAYLTGTDTASNVFDDGSIIPVPQSGFDKILKTKNNENAGIDDDNYDDDNTGVDNYQTSRIFDEDVTYNGIKKGNTKSILAKSLKSKITDSTNPSGSDIDFSNGETEAFIDKTLSKSNVIDGDDVTNKSKVIRSNNDEANYTYTKQTNLDKLTAISEKVTTFSDVDDDDISNKDKTLSKVRGGEKCDGTDCYDDGSSNYKTSITSNKTITKLTHSDTSTDSKTDNLLNKESKLENYDSGDDTDEDVIIDTDSSRNKENNSEKKKERRRENNNENVLGSKNSHSYIDTADSTRENKKSIVDSENSKNQDTTKTDKDLKIKNDDGASNVDDKISHVTKKGLSDNQTGPKDQKDVLAKSKKNGDKTRLLDKKTIKDEDGKTNKSDGTDDSDCDDEDSSKDDQSKDATDKDSDGTDTLKDKTKSTTDQVMKSKIDSSGDDDDDDDDFSDHDGANNDPKDIVDDITLIKKVNDNSQKDTDSSEKNEKDGNSTKTDKGVDIDDSSDDEGSKANNTTSLPKNLIIYKKDKHTTNTDKVSQSQNDDGSDDSDCDDDGSSKGDQSSINSKSVTKDTLNKVKKDKTQSTTEKVLKSQNDRSADDDGTTYVYGHKDSIYKKSLTKKKNDSSNKDTDQDGSEKNEKDKDSINTDKVLDDDDDDGVKNGPKEKKTLTGTIIDSSEKDNDDSYCVDEDSTKDTKNKDSDRTDKVRKDKTKPMTDNFSKSKNNKSGDDNDGVKYRHKDKKSLTKNDTDDSDCADVDSYKEDQSIIINKSETKDTRHKNSDRTDKHKKDITKSTSDKVLKSRNHSSGDDADSDHDGATNLHKDINHKKSLTKNYSNVGKRNIDKDGSDNNKKDKVLISKDNNGSVNSDCEDDNSSNDNQSTFFNKSRTESSSNRHKKDKRKGSKRDRGSDDSGANDDGAKNGETTEKIGNIDKKPLNKKDHNDSKKDIDRDSGDKQKKDSEKDDDTDDSDCDGDDLVSKDTKDDDNDDNRKYITKSTLKSKKQSATYTDTDDGIKQGKKSQKTDVIDKKTLTKKDGDDCEKDSDGKSDKNKKDIDLTNVHKDLKSKTDSDNDRSDCNDDESKDDKTVSSLSKTKTEGSSDDSTSNSENTSSSKTKDSNKNKNSETDSKENNKNTFDKSVKNFNKLATLKIMLKQSKFKRNPVIDNNQHNDIAGIQNRKREDCENDTITKKSTKDVSEDITGSENETKDSPSNHNYSKNNQQSENSYFTKQKRDSTRKTVKSRRGSSFQSEDSSKSNNHKEVSERKRRKSSNSESTKAKSSREQASSRDKRVHSNGNTDRQSKVARKRSRKSINSSASEKKSNRD